ncbi:hypothetical protein [Catenovulum sediminis]|uniref:bestrophin-like domain n=1 Tax=Catenovulum sediminis TaxID=1740262 RepID=UPI001FE484E7|nr:hypothetical protein [Catenovulum sediminis]
MQAKSDSDVKTLTSAIQTSTLGLLALLLGFTFSMSMQRYDQRSHALINETAAIEKASFQVQMLPEDMQNKAYSMLERYLALRITIGEVDITQVERRAQLNVEINQLHHAMWDLAKEAAKLDAEYFNASSYFSAIEGLIEAQSKRNALLQIRVPEVVLFLLFCVFLSAGGILGYSSGLSNKRILVPTMIVTFLITLIITVIIDLDRPKRGLIQVDKSSLQQLSKELKSSNR